MSSKYTQVLILWGDSSDTQYQCTFDSVIDGLAWVNSLGIIWNRGEGHWFKIYRQVELSEFQAYKEAVNDYSK